MTINLRLVLFMVGWICLLMATTMILPIIPSLVFHDGQYIYFFQAAVICALLGGLLIWQGWNERQKDLRTRDGLAAVGLCWLAIGFLGAVPYLTTGGIPNVWDALFESVSGFSTTGASILGDIESLPKSILFWRALSHWLGGMGIIVLMLAVLPFLGVGGMQLFKNEVPGPQVDKLRPRVRETAKYLWAIYMSFTLVLWSLLMLGGLDWFEAMSHTFSAMSTGGFSSKNISVGHFASGYVECVLIFFMYICSLNFALHYQLLTGNWRAMFFNAEFRVFLAIILIAGILVAGPVIASGFYARPLDAVRHSYFQVVAIISTTGFGTADWEQWPHFSQSILLLLFFIGGCSGSTSGGFKCIRWILLFKGAYRAMKQHIHPRAVLPIRLGGKVVPEDVVTGVWSFSIIFFLSLAISTLSLCAFDIDILTAFTAAASSLGNVGPGLGTVGPMENYGHLPGPAKGLLSFCMFLGRLEYFSMLLLFLPSFWKK